MSAPDVIVPPCTGDVAIGPLPSVCEQNLQVVVEQVGDQLRRLRLQRQKIDHKVAILKRMIKGLALLYGEELLRRPEEAPGGERIEAKFDTTEEPK